MIFVLLCKPNGQHYTKIIKGGIKMKINFKRFIATALSTAMIFSSFTYSVLAEENTTVSDETISLANVYKMEVKAGGWKESVFAEWLPVAGAAKYEVYVKKSSEDKSAYKKIDDPLIRQYPTYWRADAVGLAAGEYDLKISTLDKDSVEIAWSEQKGIDVRAYNRTGFAFSDQSTFKTGSGAYNDDGTLKDNAIVLYVTKDTAKTVTANLAIDNKGTIGTFTGLQAIITALEKGYTQPPIDIRIIGTINAADMDSFGSSAEGLQIKGKGYTNINFTLEGIGNDATIRGFGFLLRGVGNVEFRNFAIMNCMDDSVSMDTDNCNLWMHNLDIFYGQKGSASDQVKGDGTLDIKEASTWATFDENHIWDCGKTSLCGMKNDSYTDYRVTYSNNWFDHSDSRHPRMRGGTVHIYNNYYDGNSKYGAGATTGASAFVENNYFRSAKYPMLTSLQGSDMNDGKGTFSSENGGYIKEYGNIMTGKYSFITGEDAYCAKTKDEQVPDTYVAKANSNNAKYSNFDTDSKMYSYTPLAANNVPTYVISNAGRLNHGDFTWEFDNSVEDTNSEVIQGLRDAIESYSTKLVSVGGTVTTIASGTPSSLTGIDGYKNPYDPVAKLNSLNLPDQTDTSKITAGDPKNLASGSAPEGTAYDLKLEPSDFSGDTSVTTETNIKEFTIIPATDGKTDPVKLDKGKGKGVMTYGTGSKTNRAVKFTTTDKGLLYVTADSNSSSAPNRLLKVEDENGTILTGTEFNTPLSNSVVALPSAGTYYVYSGNNGINIKFLGVVYGDADVPDEPVYDNTDGFSYTKVEPSPAISPSVPSSPKSTDGPEGPVAPKPDPSDPVDPNPVDPNPVDPDKVIRWGDVSGDYYIKANDASLILEYILNKDELLKKDNVTFITALADVDGDKHITAADASLVLAKCLNSSFKFPDGKDWVEGVPEKPSESTSDKPSEKPSESTSDKPSEKPSESTSDNTPDNPGDDTPSGSAIVYNFSDEAYAGVVKESEGGKEYNINGLSIWAINDIKTDKSFDIDNLHLAKGYKVNTNNNNFITNKKAPTKNALGLTLKAGNKVTIYVRPAGNDAAGQVLLTKATNFTSITKDFTNSTGDPQKLDYTIDEDGSYYISTAVKAALIYAITIE